jgi:transposase
VIAANDAIDRHQVPPRIRRWTIKRLQHWVFEQFGRHVHRETLRGVLHGMKMSWKKAKKLLAKADPVRREAFLIELRPMLQTAWEQGELIVYIDEAHIHQDADLGYGWSPVGEPIWVNSRSPGLSKRVTFYGLYVWTTAETHIWPAPRGNQEHTISMLKRLRETYPDRRIRVIWDGASYHRAKAVHAAASALGIQVMALPGYSPDLMPVEALWKWLREEVTQNRCHDTPEELISNVGDFNVRINQEPCDLFDRLNKPLVLDPAIEKLRISN